MNGHTAVVLIDPLNDFLHPEGKLYPRMEASIESSNSVTHLKELVQVARGAHLPIFYGLHQPFRDENYVGWKYMNEPQKRTRNAKLFEEKFGGQIYSGLEPQPANGDVVVSRHWNSSAFRNTDLQYQLRQRDITHLVMAGLATNTCLESSARDARELGFQVTLLTDATASFSVELKEAATELVWPLIADDVTTVSDWVTSVSKTQL